MIIEIDNSIVEYLEKNKNKINYTNKVVVAINSIIKSFAIKKHIMFANIEILEFLSENQLIEKFNKNVVLWLIQRYSSVGMFVNSVDKRVVAYKSKLRSDIYYLNDRYYVPIEKFISINCTQLLTENDKDAEFFVDIATEVNNKVFKFTNISIEYDGRSYSGGNIETVASEVVRKFNISLCIADSDKDYKDDDKGSTLIKAIEVVKKYEKNNVISLLPLKVREKENLLPPILYIRILNHSKKFLDLLNKKLENEELLRFIDIKDGFKAKKFNSVNEKWHKLYDDFLIECDAQGILNCSLNELLTKDEDYIFLNGISDKATNKVDTYLFREGVNNRLKQMKEIDSIPSEALKAEEENLELSRNIFECLPDYLKRDWIEIGKTIIQWCCRISDEEMSVFS